jgi:hypothetical protein
LVQWKAPKPLGALVLFDPLEVIAECLGEPANSMRNPANADYRCPYSARQCSKTNHRNTLPYPVCSIYRGGRNRPGTPAHPICVCPVRFYEADIPGDVIENCWGATPPRDTRIAHEVQMQKFGKVDMVIAEISTSGAVTKFLPVELQAVDITGSYMGAYEALTQNQMAPARSKYGLNWANVRKRFMTQLVAKGYYCHHWSTRIAAVVQEDLFATFDAHAHVTECSLADSDIVFLLYQFERQLDGNGITRWSMRLNRVVPTTHMSVMQAILYETPPNKARFEKKILDRLSQAGVQYPDVEPSTVRKVAEPSPSDFAP